MEAISFGEMLSMLLTGTPSTMKSGEVPAPLSRVEKPRIWMLYPVDVGSEEVLMMFRPATLPCSNPTGLDLIPALKSSDLMEATEPVTSFFFCEP